MLNFFTENWSKILIAVLIFIAWADFSAKLDKIEKNTRIEKKIEQHEVSCKSPAKILISLHEVVYKSHIKSDILDQGQVTERPLYLSDKKR